MKKPLLGIVFLLLTLGNLSAQNVLTIDEAIDIALTNSPSIKRSKLNLERGQQSLVAQEASLSSKFSLQVTPFEFSKNRQFFDFTSEWYTSETKTSYGVFSIVQPILATDGILSLNNRFEYRDALSEINNDRTQSFANNLYLSFSQPLFTYNRTKLQLKELELDYENALLSYSIQKLSIERNVSESFYRLYEQRLRVQIANEEYNSQKQNYELTQNKVDAGILSMDELYQAELNMLNSEMSLYNAEVTLLNQYDQFKQMVGLPLDDEIEIILDLSHNPVDINKNKAIESGVSRRMELRQREIDIENTQFNLIRTSATNEFYGNLRVSAGLIGTDEQLTDVYKKPTDNQDFSISFDIPLFDWGERDARIKAAEKTIESAKISLDDQRVEIIVNIKSILRNLENLEKQIEISKVSERNAQLSYEINRERYANGDLTSIDLQQFQQQLSQSKLTKVNALLNYKLELLNLKVQSLYDFELDRPVLNQNVKPE